MTIREVEGTQTHKSLEWKVQTIVCHTAAESIGNQQHMLFISPSKIQSIETFLQVVQHGVQAT